MKILVIIPTYNEKENIKELISRVLSQNENINILIIDDNSPDGTGEIVDEIAKNNNRVEVIHRPGKMGLGSAYIQGFKKALLNGADVIFEMDADFSHNPDDIPKLLEKTNEYDVVIGSRYINGISVVNWPLKRLVISMGASLYTRLITGMKIKDCTAGFKCFKRKVLESINLDKIKSNGYSFQIEMNYRALEKGFKIGEVPIIFIDRHTGTSKMSKKIIWEAIFIVWRLRIETFLNSFYRYFFNDHKK